MKQRARMYAAVLVQENMPRLGSQVTGIPVRETLLKATGRLIEQSPGVFLADGRVESLQDLLEADAIHRVQRELCPAGRARTSLAHHRAYPAGLRPHNIILNTQVQFH